MLELPTYKLPSFENVALKVWQGASSFVKDAGTVIVARDDHRLGGGVFST